ncbi:Thiamine-monophosphate kinase [Paraliobacillus sp. PM-2]|uniref:thiamine-phosphate kinase n=1 Tax=Paraliobacillus sp. PM-2 TaxID=1462524 RepID=UPI00061C32D7|nr:thiamine-phosphate kinase [Paraliobacillus sp. PM-2]CQR47444.1 Thiamine-monophosphate kinase [Paraliobacillus sp. PM-2]
MDEFKFIDLIKQKNYQHPTIVKGIGDDAAVFRQPYLDTVTAVDTFVENIHFSRQTMTPYHVGYRLLAANISDMAAMGALPAYYMISIVVPNHWSEEDLRNIYDGMQEIASVYKMDLIGGDTVSGKELVLSVTIIGFVEQNKVRYRSAMQEDDVLFVTGTLGDASAGLHLLLNQNKHLDLKVSNLIERHQKPTPRIAFARKLQSLKRVALNDVSDGISNEANELAEASQLTVYIHYDQLPMHEALHQFKPEQIKYFMLSGGEDFELIGSVAPKDWETVKEAAKLTNTNITKIGYVTSNEATNGSVFLIENEEVIRLNKDGYTHRS